MFGGPAASEGAQRSDVGGVVLAAGLSQRFGGNKLLAPFDGKPIVYRAVAAALRSRLAAVAVVLGYEQELVRAALAELARHPRLAIVINDHYRLGQSTSVRAGLAEIEKNCLAAMFIPADQPGLTAATIERLIGEFEKSERSICYPVFRGRRCSPVVFAAAHFPSIHKLEGDIGARDIIRRHPEGVHEVDFDDERPLLDVDSPQDAAALASMMDSASDGDRTSS